MRTGFSLISSGLSLLLLACGGASSAPEVEIPAELRAQMDEALAIYDGFRVEGDEGPDGDWFEAKAQASVDIYFAPDGTIPKFEVQVPLSLLPAAVRAAAMGEMQVGDTLRGVELVYLDEVLMWEVEIARPDGSDRNLYYHPDGTLAFEH